MIFTIVWIVAVFDELLIVLDVCSHFTDEQIYLTFKIIEVEHILIFPWIVFLHA